ncbi:MAG: DUF3179 domain-containing protein [Planctomycetaceae bacterium]|nr:DUF3179 domain-containing protein [Planctomycetaceae bacterium]
MTTTQEDSPEVRRAQAAAAPSTSPLQSHSTSDLSVATSAWPAHLLSRIVRTALIAVSASAVILYVLFIQSDSEVSEALAAGQRRPVFDTRNSSIAVEEIRAGGPPKDGIPAISKPQLIGASAANELVPSERVIGVVINGEARAYPLGILSYHEIVNDTLQSTPIAVTYCPLCDSVCVFDRRTPLGTREFGVSGLLYNSNVLMYDRGGNPESLWSQLMTTGVTGPGMKKSLKTLPVELATWAEWKSRYPTTEVLSRDTGHYRDYSVSPYGRYFNTPQLMFPVNHQDHRLPAKTRVIGLWAADQFVAVPVTAFSPDQTEIHSSVNGLKFTVVYAPDTKSMRVMQADSKVQWMYTFWFAWSAFHPETDLQLRP